MERDYLLVYELICFESKWLYFQEAHPGKKK